MNGGFGLLPTKSNLLEVINEQKSVANLTTLWNMLSKTEQRCVKPFFAKRKDEIVRGINVLQ